MDSAPCQIECSKLNADAIRQALNGAKFTVEVEDMGFGEFGYRIMRPSGVPAFSSPEWRVVRGFVQGINEALTQMELAQKAER